MKPFSKPAQAARKGPDAAKARTSAPKARSVELKPLLKAPGGASNQADGRPLAGAVSSAAGQADPLGLGTALAGNPAAMAFQPDANTAPRLYAGLDVSGSTSLTSRLAAISRWRDFYDPLIGFNSARARELSETYTRGWMADLQWTYFYLEWTNPDLFALVDRRTSRLLEMDCASVVQQEADKTLAAEQSAMIDERIGKIDNIYEAIEHLEMAKFRGYAHLEKWHNSAGDLEHLEVVDQWNVVRDGLRGGWKYNPRAWQTGYFGLSEDLALDPSAFIYRECRRHINRIALLQETARRLTNVDWDAFNEIYGIPSGVVIGPQGVSQEKLGAFLTAAEEIARGGTGALPFGSIYEKNDFPRAGSPFKERLEYLTEKLLLVGTGGLLTMAARSGSGTLAGNAHADVFEQLAKADAKQISAVLNRSLVDEWMAEDFPGQPRAARLALAANEETKVGEVVAHIKDLDAAGLEVDEAEASERTGYKLKRVAKPASGAGGFGGEGGIDGNNSDPNTGDPASIANRQAKIRNARALIDSGRAVFDRNAARRLSQAQTEAMQPVLDRIATLKELPADEFAAGLQKFRADLPRLFAEARLHSPDIATVWEDVLGTALVDGLADMPIAEKASNKSQVSSSK
jgi:hypothetical protein